ncbi:MAG: zf-TFIIB domain-containing protein [Pseudomonadales bacterium]
MQCPKCDSGEMVMVHNDGVRIDRCDHCHGLYFDQLTRQDLDLVAAHADQIDTGDENLGAEFDEMVYVECPRCYAIMDQRLLEEPVRIRFEICIACHSTFLDAGEFREYLTPAYREHFAELLPDDAGA